MENKIISELSKAVDYINEGNKRGAIICLNRADEMLIDNKNKKLSKEFNRLWDVVDNI